MDFASIDVGGFNSTRWRGTNDPEYMAFLRVAMQQEADLQKALTTGSGIVQSGDQGGRALRLQFLPGELESATADQEDFVGIKSLTFEKAWAPTIEWTTKDSFDGGGDGFVDETGSDGAYGVDYYDDNFTRQTENVKFMAEGRQVSIVAEETRNIEDSEKVSRVDVELSLLAKANTALYFGNAMTSFTQYNGVLAQLEEWLDLYPADAGILYDAGGRPLDKYMLEDIAAQNRNKFGRISLVLMSTPAYGDSQTLIWPTSRSEEGGSGRFGGQRDIFAGPAGDIRIKYDPGLRPQRPLRVQGPGSDGAPRLNVAGSRDANNLPVASNPFVAASSTVGVQALAAGSANWWRNYTRNTDGTFPAVPAAPSGTLAYGGGNNSNHLAAGTYYYGVSSVYKGQESALYVYGAGLQAADVISGSPTGLVTAANLVNQIELDPTVISGLGSTYARKNVKFRLYRFGGPGAAAPTNVSQFQYLAETGIPVAGNTRIYDNGMWIPGTDMAFGITTMKGKRKGWAMYQLLPLMLRPLPNLPLADPIVLLWFTTLLMRVRRHHVVIRNIGRA